MKGVFYETNWTQIIGYGIIYDANDGMVSFFIGRIG